MSDLSKISLIKEMLESAESSIRSAKLLLLDVSSLPDVDKKKYSQKAGTIASEIPVFEQEGRIVQGVFNGQGMIDKEDNAYPVPANYASKSKLIPGDILKLTIPDDGKFIYKQIGPIPRKTVIGPLVFEDGQYKVLANGKAYKVLLASVTYFKADVGDEVTLIIPTNEETEWGAIEAVLPKFENFTVSDSDDDEFLEAEEPPKKRGRKKKSDEEELDELV